MGNALIPHFAQVGQLSFMPRWPVLETRVTPTSTVWLLRIEHENQDVSDYKRWLEEKSSRRVVEREMLEFVMRAQVARWARAARRQDVEQRWSRSDPQIGNLLEEHRYGR